MGRRSSNKRRAPPAPTADTARIEAALARQRAARTASQAPAAPSEIPGFAYDASRNRYFPGAAATPPPPPDRNPWGEPPAASVVAPLFALATRAVMRARCRVAVGPSASGGAACAAAARASDGAVAAATAETVFVADGDASFSAPCRDVSCLRFCDGSLLVGEAGGAGVAGSVVVLARGGRAPGRAIARVSAPRVRTLWCADGASPARLALGGGAGARRGRAVGAVAFVADGAAVATFELPSDAFAARVDGDAAVVGCRDGVVRRVDSRGGPPTTLLDRLDGGVDALEPFEPGRYVAASKRGDVALFDERVPGRRVLSLARPPGAGRAAGGVAVSAALRACAAADAGGVCRAWSLDDGAVLAAAARPGGGPCVALGCAAAGDVLPAFAFLDRADGAFLQLTARAEGVS